MKKLIMLICILGGILIALLTIGIKMINNTYVTAAYTEPIETHLEEPALLPVSENNTKVSTSVTEPLIQEEEKKIITLSAAGDCTLGYSAQQSTWNRFDVVVKEKGYDYFFENVKSIFEQDDLTIINLEGPLTRLGTAVQKEFVFRGEPEYVNILTGASIEVVNLANNHTRDYGEEGYYETQRVLREAGIGFFGEQTIFYDTLKGIRIGIIGMKGWSSDKWVRDNLRQLMSEAKSNSDLIIVMFHWGVEGSYYPVQIQKDLAKYAIDEGAHLILGSHPHVIQGIENYNERNIVYSMGNFCFGGNRNPSDKDSFIYQETFELTDQGIISIDNQIIPCSISSVKERNDYRPTPLTGEEKHIVEKRLKLYSTFK